MLHGDNETVQQSINSLYYDDNQSEFIIDSAATTHVIKMHDNILHNTTHINTSAEAANGTHIPLNSQGTVNINDSFKLLNAKSGPTINKNLISVPAHLKDFPNQGVFFFKNTALFISRGDLVWKFINNNMNDLNVHSSAERKGDLFILTQDKNESNPIQINAVITHEYIANLMTTDRLTWHHRLGHFNNNGALVNSSADKCQTCISAKAKRGSFSSTSKRVGAVKRGQILHFDIAGPVIVSKRITLSDSSQPNDKEIIERNKNTIMDIITREFGHGKYLGVLVDDFSRMKFTKTFEFKKDASTWLKTTLLKIRNQTGNAIIKLYTDGAAETRTIDFEKWCSEQGITHLQTNTATSQNNAIPERAIQTIFCPIRAVLFTARLPSYFWPAAVPNCTFATNSLRRKAITKSPEMMKSVYELFHNHPIPISLLRVWGCDADVLIPEAYRPDRISSRTIPCIYLGIDSGRENGSIFLDTINWKIIYQRTNDCTFHENQFTYGRQAINGSQLIDIDNIEHPIYDIEIIDDKESIPIAPQPSLPSPSIANANPSIEIKEQINDIPQASPIIPAKWNGRPRIEKPKAMKKRKKQKPIKRKYFLRKLKGRKRAKIKVNLTTLSLPLIDPKDINNDDLDSTPSFYYDSLPSHWKNAVKKEYDTLMSNNTWKLVPPPEGRKIIKCKWVFKIKVDPSTKQRRYKARLTVKGCSQVPGIDFDPDDISSTVMRVKSLRLMLTIAVTLGYRLNSMDAVSAFTQSTLHEDIYMEQPAGYIDEQNPNYVCKLIMSLYGLKQASENWHKDVVSALLSLKFKSTLMDDNIFVFISNTDNYIFICVYVDDFTSCYHPQDEKQFTEIQSHLLSTFHMNNLGDTTSVLGIKIKYDIHEGILSLSQQNYIEDILREFKMTECNGVNTPCQKEVDYRGPLSTLHNPMNQEEIDYMKTKPYRKVVGMLLYLVNCTRPDILYSVGVISRFSSNPGPQHWMAAMRILRYLKTTKSLTLNFYRRPLIDDKFLLQTYCDADWGNDVTTRRSIHGIVTMLQGCPISWTSKKQNFVALSSTESEYVGLSEAVRENISLLNLLHEIKLPLHRPIIMGDNSASLFVAQAKSMNTKIKSIDIKYHFIKDEVAYKKNFILKKISTDDNVADIFTKPLDKTKNSKFTNLLLGSSINNPINHEKS